MAERQKTGGRQAGTPNNRTLALRQRLEAAQGEAKHGDRILAIKVLRDLMMVVRSLAAKHQPLDLKEGEKPPEGRKPDEAKFKEYAVLTKDICAVLAPFESPRLTQLAVDVSHASASEEAAGATDELIRVVDALADAQEFERNTKIIDVEANKPEPEEEDDEPTLVGVVQ